MLCISTASSPEVARTVTVADRNNREDTLKTDLMTERPGWILSNFGAAKNEPNLFFGYDHSPEEMRWKSVQAIKAGKGQDYVSTSSLVPAFYLILAKSSSPHTRIRRTL
jgi:hypothetical protein